MTFKTILNAFPKLQQFFKVYLRTYISYSLYKLLKACQNEIDFYAEEEKKLIEKYGNISEQGDITFSEEKNKTKFLEEIEKLQKLEIEKEIKKISIPLDSIQSLALSPADFYALENLIDFVEEEE